MVLFYTFPAFVVLFSALLFQTRIEMGEVLLIGVGLLGAYVLIDPHFHSLNPGHLFALLGSAIGGMAAVMVHKARERNGPLIIYFYFCLTGTLLSLPFVQEFRVPNANQAIVLILASIAALVAQILMNQGFRYCGAAEGSLILMSEIIFAGIGGFLIFKDPFTTRFLLGALLIVGSGLGLNLINRRSRHAPVSEPGDA
jgi:drug/metabolite transporter (DMT)-like permease